MHELGSLVPATGERISMPVLNHKIPVEYRLVQGKGYRSSRMLSLQNAATHYNK